MSPTLSLWIGLLFLAMMWLVLGLAFLLSSRMTRAQRTLVQLSAPVFCAVGLGFCTASTVAGTRRLAADRVTLYALGCAAYIAFAWVFARWLVQRHPEVHV